MRLTAGLKSTLKSRSDPRLAESTRRYFPTDIRALGVRNAEVRRLADAFVQEKGLSPEERLAVMYPFFLTRTHAITRIQHWTGSPSPWCRRAANVALVKFVSRKVRSSTYMLPLEVILGNAQRLLSDPEPYVQKSVGWLLKVAADHHRDAVVGFIQEHRSGMQRDTLRYAIERLEPEQRKALRLAFTR